MTVEAEGGGGASRSTEPAAGTSAATDVSLHAHIVGMIHAERVLTNQQLTAQAAQAKALRDGDIEAAKTAFTANETLTRAHNDLLRRMELQSETYATREALDRRLGRSAEQVARAREDDDLRFKRLETWQARLSGGLLLLSAIGVSNFVKVWT